MYNMENEVKEPVPKCNFVSVQGYFSQERVAGYYTEYDDEYILAIAGRPF